MSDESTERPLRPVSDRRHAEERPEAASRSTPDAGASFETPASRAPQDDAGRSFGPNDQPARPLTPAARRALDEAVARRAAHDAHVKELAARTERNGRGGLDPVRYADWEIGGRAVDF